MKNSFFDALKKFHDDEDGAAALETIIILAIAILVLIVFIVWGKDIVSMVKKWAEPFWKYKEQPPIQ